MNNTPTTSRTAWWFLGLCLVALALIALLLWRIPSLWSTEVSEKTTLWVASIRAESKYVIASQSLTATASRSENYRHLAGYVSGTTSVKLRVDGCRVQYFIPTQGLTSHSFQYDSRSHALVASFPRPVLDEEMIDIPSDPAQWSVESSSAWFRFNKGEVEDKVRKSFRGEVLKVARERGFDEATRCLAVERMKKTLADALGLSPEKITVRFQ